VILDRVKSFRPDWAAAFWFAVSYLASIFAVYPVLIAWLIFSGQGVQMDPTYAFVAPGILSFSIFAFATYRLVASEPWRRFPTTMLTLYALQLAVALIFAVLSFIRAPYALGSIGLSLVGPLTWGFVDIISASPLKFATPDVWIPLGAMVGFALGRRRLKAEGRQFGPAADVHLRPLRLPDVAEINPNQRRDEAGE
jgi:hypothetical protein